MTIASYFGQHGFMIRLLQPLWVSNDWPPVEFRREIVSYNQQSAALGGYWAGSVRLSLSRSEAESLYGQELGRHVEMFDSFGKFFEGCVNKATYNFGSVTVVRGPLLNVANHVRCLYSTLDTTDPTQVVGVREVTSTIQDSDSQDKYGILQMVLSVGGAATGNPEQIRDTYLEDFKDPVITSTLSVGAMPTMTVTLEIVGYSQFLNTYVLENASTGTQSASAKIQYILGANPNSIYSTDYDRIDTNATQINVLESDYRLAWDVLKSVVAEGDSSYNRWLFAVYDEQTAEYNSIPLDSEYEYKLADKKQLIYDKKGLVYPWRLRPGKWLTISDLLPGYLTIINPTTQSELRQNPRMMFIENVTYNLPNSLSIVGSQVGKTSQLLARLGLGGIG